MADEQNKSQHDDPFRGHLTLDELDQLSSGTLTLAEIFANRDKPSTNTPEDDMKEDAIDPNRNPALEEPEPTDAEAQKPKTEQTEIAPSENAQPSKIEIKDDTEVMSDTANLEIHTMADPFAADAQPLPPAEATVDKPAHMDQAQLAMSGDEKTHATSVETSQSNEQVDDSFFKEIKPQSPKDYPDTFAPQFTSPEPPTYYAGASFIDQTGGLGSTTVIPIQNSHAVTDPEKVALQAENAEADMPEGVKVLQPEGAVSKAAVDAAEEAADEETSSRMLRGSFWMTAGSLASRLLGALYVIPWMAMLGYTYANQANAVYGQGYQIYSLALMVATAGLPNVLARLVAEYASKKEFSRVQQIFKQSLLLGGVMGIIAGGVLYVFATPLGQGDPNVARVVRSLAPAVLIIPSLAMMRGYMQGFEFMGASALSQFMEQVVRVLYMLALTYWIMIGHHGNWVDATVQSTFAAFWGALAGTIVLAIAIWHKRAFFAEQARTQTPVEPIDATSLIVKMVKQSIPVILAGSAIAILQLIDQYSFANIMKRFTEFSNLAITNMFAQFAVNANKLIMLVISLAVGMAETALPMLARAREIGSRENISHQIQYAFKLLSFILIPAALGMASVARPLYLLFYTTNDAHNGTLVLQYASFTAVILGLYMVVLAIYQGLNQLGYTVKMLAIIVMVKVVLQFPLVLWLNGMGPLVSTAIAFAVGLFFAIRKLTAEFDMTWQSFMKDLVGILFWSLIMYVVAAVISAGLSAILPDGKLWQLLIILIAGGVGAFIYGVAALKSQIAADIFGPRVQKLADKLPF